MTAQNSEPPACSRVLINSGYNARRKESRILTPFFCILFSSSQVWYFNNVYKCKIIKYGLIKISYSRLCVCVAGGENPARSIIISSSPSLILNARTSFFYCPSNLRIWLRQASKKKWRKKNTEQIKIKKGLISIFFSVPCGKKCWRSCSNGIKKLF